MLVPNQTFVLALPVFVSYLNHRHVLFAGSHDGSRSADDLLHR